MNPLHSLLQRRGGARPNASWAGPDPDVAGAPTVSPFRAGASGVGGMRPLPRIIPYGPQPQGLQQNTAFTGGSVPGGAMSLVSPQQPQVPSFASPTFPQMSAGPTHALATLATLLTGAVGGPPAHAPNPTAPPHATAAPPHRRHDSGPVPPGSPAGGLFGIPPASSAGGLSAEPKPTGLTAAQIIAALALAGQHLNPSSPGGSAHYE